MKAILANAIPAHRLIGNPRVNDSPAAFLQKMKPPAVQYGSVTPMFLCRVQQLRWPDLVQSTHQADRL
jgi:hypothetical protein